MKKNNPAALNKSSGAKQRTVALIVISVLISVAITMAVLKKSDHRVELRYVIESRDNVRLEQLLKAHPRLVEAQLPNRNPKDLWTPLHMAACYGDLESVEILIKHKAKVNEKDSNGLTPLHWTVALDRYDSAQLLINKGADMNAKGNDGRTPIELAKLKNGKKMIELFRVRGAKE